MGTKRVLFVCTGNTCRSTMAEVLARDFLHRRALEGGISPDDMVIEVLSAGTGAIEGEPAAPQARAVMEERGLDLSQHRARFLTAKMMQEADLILTMTEKHKQYIEEIMPEAKGKVFILKEYAQGDQVRPVLQEKANQIYQEIEHKKVLFYQQHQEELDALEKKKMELLQQLEQVDNQFRVLERQFAQTVEREIDELNKLKMELKDLDIYDPFGQLEEHYRQCAEELAEHIPKALDRFIRESSPGV
ncbi:MAG TPA: protein tyrosine phosphatase [Clostridia bacterium]|nr:protein tyrosine phosphatase [Clostridia bacterium]HPZ70944.1 hypothetical protein [Peptococcaceae bacterium]